MRTVYGIRDTAGVLIAEHVRVALPSGKRMYWQLPGCDPRDGLGGLATSDLPLYGSDLLAHLEPGRTVLVTEGERASEAPWSLGFNAVATVTGAGGTPGEDALSPLLPFDVVLWPDYDPAGRDHMARVAVTVIRLGGQCRLLRWNSACEKGDDAADFIERGGTRDTLAELVRKAKPVEVVYRPPAPTPQPLASYGDSDDRRQQARASLADVVSARLGAPRKREGRSWFWHCPFHDEKTASFKVDLREPFYRCFGCGTKGDVFSFLRALDGRSFQEALAELAPLPYSGILGRYAE